MLKNYPLIVNLQLWLELITAIIAIIYYPKNRDCFWKLFVFYVVIIAVFDNFSNQISNLLHLKKAILYAFCIIPLQYLFFFWLYSIKSLKNKKLFFIFTTLYLLSFIPIELYFKSFDIVYSFNMTVGTLLLMILVFLEFRKQIQNDDILQFWKNKMFYINIGIMLFYVGTLPFFGLYNLIVKEPSIWNAYYLYFLISNCLMYLLFTASFIWGKPKL
ncbi:MULTISPECIES: hypothetical protein [Flavobacterium]|uniref:hypothetical protein n=1 Tax=Flavobacterium TaxID=237 RepID=UPI001F3F6BEE|nr:MULTISPECIES: hypothetical protein [Flavobacterium]